MQEVFRNVQNVWINGDLFNTVTPERYEANWTAPAYNLSDLNYSALRGRRAVFYDPANANMPDGSKRVSLPNSVAPPLVPAGVLIDNVSSHDGRNTGFAGLERTRREHNQDGDSYTRLPSGNLDRQISARVAGPGSILKVWMEPNGAATVIGDTAQSSTGTIDGQRGLFRGGITLVGNWVIGKMLEDYDPVRTDLPGSPRVFGKAWIELIEPYVA